MSHPGVPAGYYKEKVAVNGGGKGGAEIGVYRGQLSTHR